MGGQFAWLWVATIGQIWTKTTLLGWTTTILVRRLIIWLPFGVYFGWMQAGGAVSGIAQGLLFAPFAAGLAMVLMTFGQALWRLVSMPFTTFGGIFGLPGLVLLKLADLWWRLEAGPGPGAAQDVASANDVLENQKLGVEDQLHNSVLHSGGLNGAFASPIDIVANTDQGQVAVQEPRLSGGKLVGRVDGVEVVVGRVTAAGSGYRVEDDSGKTVLQVDRRGFDSSGNLVVKLEGTDDADWKGFMSAEGRQRPKLGRGPLVQTVVAAIVIAVSFGTYTLKTYLSTPSTASDATTPGATADAGTNGPGGTGSRPTTAPLASPPSDGGSSRSLVDTPSLMERIRGGEAIAAGELSTNCDELWTARNWVYARHGYSFSTQKAKSWFGEQQGYQRDESVTSKTIGARLTAADVANRDLLVQHEKASGCR